MNRTFRTSILATALVAAAGIAAAQTSPQATPATPAPQGELKSSGIAPNTPTQSQQTEKMGTPNARADVAAGAKTKAARSKGELGTPGMKSTPNQSQASVGAMSRDDVKTDAKTASAVNGRGELGTPGVGNNASAKAQ